ncbi:hypothetical protein SPRG_10276 [Saprolegnia parasitica CBS 223.65]|uniref:WW domain-containing protein n=1 Tax=Saprolegnia parasitica (strain CBS 223.65) TaxID=695850 RepID=A0A067CD69_SAPPC|nr:hypothetical protein SPRG_10276 [Saprolegnia parasitica CBS 223.65]KDO24742.1 hypothetical protein SPRG_10276 [Saprolegnia parasitica CBS 223.65]|eukprot:XP_012204622.1 hypothetical protein SPRG_10276 [Saprolegnia parasitica CBS 223.65]
MTEETQARIRDLLDGESLRALHDRFDALSIEDVDALRSFPSHPHRCVHILLGAIYLVLFEVEHPSFYKLTWSFLRETLLRNPSAFVHRLHGHLRTLTHGEAAPLSTATIDVCLVYLEEPSFRLAAVAKISAIAAALGSWVYLCLATVISPYTSHYDAQTNEQESPVQQATYRRTFRHVIRRHDRLFLALVHATEKGLRVAVADASGQRCMAASLPRDNHRVLSLLRGASSHPHLALHAAIAQAMHTYEWPFNPLSAGIGRPCFPVLCYVLVVDAAEMRMISMSAVFGTLTMPLARLRDGLRASDSSHFYYRGSRVAHSTEARLRFAHVLPLVVLVQKPGPRRHVADCIAFAADVQVHLRVGARVDLPDVAALPHVRSVGVQLPISDETRETLIATLNQWSQRGYDAMAVARERDRALCLRLPPRPTELDRFKDARKYHDMSLPTLVAMHGQEGSRTEDDAELSSAIPMYLLASLQATRVHEWLCSIDAPCPVPESVMPHLAPGSRLRLVNGLDVVVAPATTAPLDPLDVRYQCLLRRPVRGHTVSCPSTSNLWRLVPPSLDARPRWLQQLQFYVRHPTIEYVASPLHFAFFRVRIPYAVPEDALENAFWSAHLDWTPYVAATPTSDLLCTKFKELCETYPSNYFVDSVKFAKLIRDCGVTPELLPLGLLDRIFFKHACPIFQHQMERDGFLAALNAVVAEVYRKRIEPDPLRAFVLEHLTRDPHSKTLWTTALERYRSQAKLDRMEALARRMCAATRLQAAYRGHAIYAQYLHHLAQLRRRRRTVLVLQRYARMWIAKGRYVVLVAALRERQRLEAVEAERRRVEELQRQFLLGRRVRLQRWARHRLGWRRFFRRMHPEWVGHLQRLKSRRRLFLYRFGGYVDGRRFVVSVFRCHIDLAKDRQLHLELFDPIWADLAPPDKVQRSTLHEQLRLVVRRLYINTKTQRVMLHQHDAHASRGRRLAHRVVWAPPTAYVVSVSGVHYDYVLRVYEPISSALATYTLPASLAHAMVCFMQRARHVTWHCCGVRLDRPALPLGPARYLLTSALDCPLQHCAHNVLKALTLYVATYGVVAPTASMLPDVVLAEQLQQQHASEARRNLKAAAARTLQARCRGILARQHFRRRLPSLYVYGIEPATGRRVYTNRVQGTIWCAPPFARLYPGVRFEVPTDEWLAQYDAASGRVYYYNPARGRSTWWSQDHAARALQRLVRRRRFHDAVGCVTLPLLVQALTFHTNVPQTFSLTLPLDEQKRCALHALAYHELDKAYRLLEAILSVAPGDVLASVALALLLLVSGKKPQNKNRQRATRLLQMAKQRDSRLRDVTPLEDACFRWRVIADPTNALALGLYALYQQHIVNDIDRAETLYRRALVADALNEPLLYEYNALQHERSPIGAYASAGPSKHRLPRSVVLARDGAWEQLRDTERGHVFWRHVRTKHLQWGQPAETTASVAATEAHER